MSMTKPTSEQVTFKSQGLGAVTRNVQDKLADVVSVKDFGAVGDGVADDTAAIQAAIDWVIYRNQAYNAPRPAVSPGAVYLPGGVYRITDTIQLGYGISFTTAHIYGDGIRFRNSSLMQGTAIVADFNDRPALAVSGGRFVSIEAMTIVGKADTWMTANNLGSVYSTPLVDDTVESNWVDPSFPASASSRYAPYCGIAIDPYSGTRPAVSYPDVNFPGWLNWTTQYGKSSSDRTYINNVEIYGFVVGVAVKPSNASGNGDYTTVSNCRFGHVVYGISVGHTQARDFGVINTQFQTFYCGVTTGAHGQQIGMPSFCLTNCSFLFGMIGAIIPNLNYASQVSFTNVYSEGLWKIGIFTSNATSTGSISFLECEFSMDLWLLRGIPASPLSSSACVTMIGTTIKGLFANAIGANPNILHLDCNAQFTSLTNCLFDAGADAQFLYEKHAVNATRGIAFRNAGTNLSEMSVRTPRIWNLLTGTAIATNQPIATESDDRITRTTCIAAYCSRAMSSSSSSTGILLPFRGNNFLITKASCASISQAGRTVTVDTTGAISNAVVFTQSGGDVGDVVCDQATSTIFIVAARTGLTLTLVAQNNIDANGNLSVTITTSGAMHTMNCRLFAMQFLQTGDLSSSSSTISNVADSGGVSRNVNSSTLGVQAGDSVFVGDGNGLGICSQANAVIASVASNSITLSGNPYYTQTRQRLELFVKQPPANNT